MTMNDNLEHAVRLLEKCRADLRTKLERNKRDLEAVERSIQLLQGESTGPLVVPDPNQSPYAHLGPRAAVSRFFRENPGRALKPSAIAKALVDLGYQRTNPDPNVFVTQVRTVCIRLTEKGRLTKTELDGKTAFRLVEEHAPKEPG
jgi:hypothetical protein